MAGSPTGTGRFAILPSGRSSRRIGGDLFYLTVTQIRWKSERVYPYRDAHRRPVPTQSVQSYSSNIMIEETDRRGRLADGGTRWIHRCC
ncbi:hypothetical protein K227x_06650 [Rubripirellula lacrimiformis]|uniref:Uncharacterized protein n=1 Tax=Rubripirellula lacrimiformis TaxID=1930273 RepID=A0A517N574_9BACT|nr:hypothetical protein K227x_06650 [Rubripirellula lacrimiformis]